MAFGKSRDPKKESFWRRMVRRYARSDLSVRAWCEKQGLREATFHWWRGELARRDRERRRFVEVRVKEDEFVSREGRIEIVLAGGRSVCVSGRVDRATLADVVSILTSASSVEPEERAC